MVSKIPAHKDIISDLGYGFLVETTDSVIDIINSNKNNYCAEKHKKFVDKWRIKNVVLNEVNFLKSL